MTLSISNDLYTSKAFDSWKNSRENDQKLSLALLDRMDGLSRQVNELGKVLARR
jgi:hypothetical protein